MAKLDHAKFADKALAIVIGKKPESNDEMEHESDHESEDSENKPGELGKILLKAIEAKDPEAIEEAIKQISEDCPE